MGIILLKCSIVILESDVSVWRLISDFCEEGNKYWFPIKWGNSLAIFFLQKKTLLLYYTPEHTSKQILN